MKLTKCASGHFYDADKYPECPYCNTGLQTDSSIVRSGAAEESPEGTPVEPAVPAAAPAGPVAGWLVVLDGEAKGRDLRLGVGRTFLGLDKDGTPVTLSADAPLSLRQAVLVYDGEAKTYTLPPPYQLKSGPQKGTNFSVAVPRRRVSSPASSCGSSSAVSPR